MYQQCILHSLFHYSPHSQSSRLHTQIAHPKIYYCWQYIDRPNSLWLPKNHYWPLHCQLPWPRQWYMRSPTYSIDRFVPDTGTVIFFSFLDKNSQREKGSDANIWKGKSIFMLEGKYMVIVASNLWESFYRELCLRLNERKMTWGDSGRMIRSYLKNTSLICPYPG